MPCMGNGDDHCCYVAGEPCKYLITDYTDETGHHRKWACGLRAELGNWDDVLASDRYQRDVHGRWRMDMNCRDWPDAESGPNMGVCTRPECNVPESRF